MKGIHRRAPKRGPIVARRGIALGLVLTLFTAGIALADNLIADGDELISGANNLSLDSVCPTESLAGNALLEVERRGSGNVFADNAAITVTAGTPTNPSVTAIVVDNAIALPGNWVDSRNGEISGDKALAAVSVVGALPAGAKSATVAFTATGADKDSTPTKPLQLSRSAALTVTWTVRAETDPVCAPADTTPPSIDVTVSPALPSGENGWYVDNVTVDWTVTDLESPAVETGCADTTINYDTTGETLTCSATSIGGTTVADPVTIKRDATAPAATPGGPLADGANGWYVSEVEVAWGWSDDTSGVDPSNCTATSPSASEGELVLEADCFDMAGNKGEASFEVNVDLSDPDVALVDGPQNGGVYYFGYVPAQPTCDASDAISKLDTCVVSGWSSLIGSHTVVATATDVAGRSAVSEASYEVRSWSIDGFFRPVDMAPGIWNTVKGGSTVPLKFRIAAGDMNLTAVSSIRSLKSVTMPSCLIQDSTVTVDELTPTSDNTTLRYDTDGAQFIYNWKTPKLSATACYKVTLTTVDGSMKSAYFQVNK